MTLRDLLELVRRDYRLNDRVSTPALEASAKALERILGADMPAENITPAVVETYKDARLGEGRSRKTVNYDLGILARGFQLALDQELIDREPRIRKLKGADRVRTGFVDPAEFRRLLRALEVLDRDVADLVRWLYLTGWRTGESRRLRWGQVDLGAGLIQLPPRQTKNRRTKTLAIGSGGVRALLERRRAVREGPWVFHRSGRKIVRFRASWRRAVKAIGRPELRPHDLRRSFVRNAERAGVPRKVAMEIGGWSTESMYRRYNIVDEARMAEGIDRVGAYVEGDPNST